MPYDLNKTCAPEALTANEMAELFGTGGYLAASGVHTATYIAMGVMDEEGSMLHRQFEEIQESIFSSAIGSLTDWLEDMKHENSPRLYNTQVMMETAREIFKASDYAFNLALTKRDLAAVKILADLTVDGSVGFLNLSYDELEDYVETMRVVD